MNKTEYMIKKGMIPPPSDGEMYIIRSDRKGVTIKKVPFWEVKKGIHVRYSVNDKKEFPYTEYKIDDYYRNIKIFEDEGSFYQDDGYATGWGDLWYWSYFYTIDETIANELFEKETKRVNEKYLSNSEEAI